ncbi:MAG: glycine/sarcosine/betaine reductase component B subunit [Defluviitaleaceae bacterium]|nr:glycine/sarcosine/betaine reductase component B subunit [Defluviitaleaceae bacterium]
MRLELGRINVTGLGFTDGEANVKDGVLQVNAAAIRELVLKDARIKSVEVELALPGEKTRVTPVKDVIEPRVKVEGDGKVFPGMIGNKVDTVGNGRTHVLSGAAVVTCGKIVGFQEGIIDMSGPGADYTPFSKTNNVVLVIEPADGLLQHDYEDAARQAGLKAASILGETAAKLTPDSVEVYETPTITEGIKKFAGLPRVGYVYMLQTQGLLHDTYVYGVDAKKIMPTILYPTEIFDGAVTSGNCVSACDKNTTYHHQNSPVVEDLFAKHGKEINFVGVIVTNENVFLADKERSSNQTAKLCEYLGLDAVIISEEGFGNPDTDLIMNCKKIEMKGIKTVVITDEYAGRDGRSQSLADADVRADAMVSAANANEIIVLPPMERIIGMTDYTDKIAGGFDGSLRPDGSIEAEIQIITGATNELGFNKLTTVEV